MKNMFLFFAASAFILSNITLAVILRGSDALTGVLKFSYIFAQFMLGGAVIMLAEYAVSRLMSLHKEISRSVISVTGAVSFIIAMTMAWIRMTEIIKMYRMT